MASYIAWVRKDLDSSYGIEFPDFPGCISAGDTLEEVRQQGAEALAFHIEGMIEDGAAIPEPTLLSAIDAAPATEGAMLVLIDGPAKPAKSLRVNVLLPADLVERIDRASGNRSRFLADAARAKLGEAA